MDSGSQFSIRMLFKKIKYAFFSLKRLNNSPLSIAISNDYLFMVHKLLDNINLVEDIVNLPDENGDTPLIKAIWLLMSSSINKDQVHMLVKRLIECGADINARNDSGRTPLFTAIYQNNTEIALYLIEKGAECELDDVLMSNFTLLHYACFQGNLILCKALLEKKCDPNSIATSCESPVYIAVTKGYLDILDLLIEYGANVNTFIGTECDNKCTALQATIYYLQDYDLFKKIVDKLIIGGANLDICQPGPIIYISLQYNKIKFAKYLVSVGTSVHIRTVFNQSPFYKAFLSKNLEFMEMCVMAGFSLYDESWIEMFIDNPEFIAYTDYYIRKASSTDSTDENNNHLNEEQQQENRELVDQDQNAMRLGDMLDMDQYFFERFHLNSSAKKRNQLIEEKQRRELAKRIYNFVSYNYKNPLSLKQLSRIAIRNHMLSIDYKMSQKIMQLSLPRCLKDYLLMKEFNL
jgi:ankyrin repeat protein